MALGQVGKSWRMGIRGNFAGGARAGGLGEGKWPPGLDWGEPGMDSQG